MCSKYEKLFVFSILLLIITLSFNCKKNPTIPNMQDLTKPLIWISTFEMTFSASISGPNPATQTITIKNTGQGTLNYTISDNADWLSITENSGTSTGQAINHNISVDKSSLSAKDEYTAKILITSSEAYNNPQKVNVSLTISDDEDKHPEIQFSPTNLAFTAQVGGNNPSSKNIFVSNSGEGTLDYLINCGKNWLSISPNSGQSQGKEKKHIVSADISGLDSGAYSAIITISDLDATNSPQKVNVSLTISEAEEAQPEIQVIPTYLSFSAQIGGGDPGSQNIYIQNTGDSTLHFEVESDSSWISVDPSSGTSKNYQKTIKISVNISGLNAGTHQGDILIIDPDATNSPQKVNVNLEITEESPPKISIDPKNITFQAFQGGSNPSPAYLFVSNSGEGTLIYSIDWDTNWLSVSPNNGQTKEVARKHTVSANVSGLNAGSYSATITVSDPNASNSPKRTNVTLNIISIPTDNKLGISISPSSGPTGTIVSIPISILGNTSEISTFGLEMHFDANMFEFQSVSSGSLTGNWGAVSGNETSSGTITIGGVPFSGTPISIGSSGSIAVVKFRVTGSSYNNGDTSQVTINNLVDISGMTVSPSSVTFTYTE
jgi:hypothetical protein